MKKALLLSLSFLGISIASLAQIDLAIDYKTFHSPGEKPYLEFYLSLNGQSLEYVENENGMFQAAIEMTYIISQGDSIINFKKFQLISPEYGGDDPLLDIIDLKRIPVPNGESYSFEFNAVDLNSNQTATNKVALDPIQFTDDKMQLSEVQLANQITAVAEPSPFSKNGVEIIPNIGNFFNEQHKQLAFYLEIYNAQVDLGKDQDFLLEYAIVNPTSNLVINNLRGFKRLKTAPVIPVVQVFPIENLPSGNFKLTLDIKNRSNESLLKDEVLFQRSNPSLKDLTVVDASNSFVSNITDIELLKEYIRSCTPISSYAEIQFAQNQLEYSKLEFMQQYFLNFWNTRNPNNPEQEWLAYKKEVEIADQEFGYGGVKGYQTERGRVYLQYGKPNARQKVPYEPNTYPYSIWQYYKLNGLTNRKFVFYSPSMEMLGYKLLHTNVPGEIQNPNWEAELENKTVNRGNTYELNQGEVINSRAKDLFDNPR